MMEMCQVTELMHNNVVAEMWRKKQYLVVKVEILVRGTTPPTPALVTDSHAIP